MKKLAILSSLISLFGCGAPEMRHVGSDATAAYFKACSEGGFNREFAVIVDAVHHLKLIVDRRSINPEEGKKLLVDHFLITTGNRRFADHFGGLIVEMGGSYQNQTAEDFALYIKNLDSHLQRMK